MMRSNQDLKGSANNGLAAGPLLALALSDCFPLRVLKSDARRAAVASATGEPWGPAGLLARS